MMEEIRRKEAEAEAAEAERRRRDEEGISDRETAVDKPATATRRTRRPDA
jgi:hypothetical protein